MIKQKEKVTEKFEANNLNSRNRNLAHLKLLDYGDHKLKLSAV